MDQGEKRRSPRVCVIGAGGAGLTTIKQLKDQGVADIDCFEKSYEVGGVFNYGEDKDGVYDNAYLTISNYYMAFSDMPPEGHRYHWHHTEYEAYLIKYSKEFDLRKHIRFHTTVLTLEGGPGRWHVVVQAEGQEPEDRGHYDAVAICSGSFQVPYIPEWPGLETFTGKVIHSSQYKRNDAFKDKECVCVGIGESGADIVREISDVSKKTTLIFRTVPFLIPRLVAPYASNPRGMSSDSYSSRLHHEHLHLPVVKLSGLRAFLDRILYTVAGALYSCFPYLGHDGKMEKDAFNQEIIHNDGKTPPMADKDLRSTPEVGMSIIYTNQSGKHNDIAWPHGINRHGQKFACKNVTWMGNVVNGKLAWKCAGVAKVDGDFVEFTDGDRLRADYLVACTGYRSPFKFLKGNIGSTDIPLSVPDQNVRNLYMQVFHNDIGPSMAWIGFVRPQTGGVPFCAEMAARYFAQLVTGQKQLPSNAAEVTRKDKALYMNHFRMSSDIHTLVNFKMWVDVMADNIGCSPKWWRYLFSDPKLFVRVALGSMLPSQFRLDGPGAMPEQAKATIKALAVAPTESNVRNDIKETWMRYLNPLTLFVTNE